MSSKTFSIPIELRFSDIDSYGHVNNAIYLTFLETARVKLFDQQKVDFSHSGVLFVVARAECEYKKPIVLADKVIIDLTIQSIGKVSFDIHYNIHNGEGTLFAKAKTTMVTIHPESHKTTSIPDSVKEALT